MIIAQKVEPIKFILEDKSNFKNFVLFSKTKAIFTEFKDCLNHCTFIFFINLSSDVYFLLNVTCPDIFANYQQYQKTSHK